MKTKVCVGHVKGKRKTKISWYEKIDKRFAIKHGVSRFNSDLMDDRHKPCIKCAGTIRITNSMKCAICQCKDGKFALIPIKTRDKDVRAYSDNVSKKGARREYAREWARKNKDIVILRNMIHRLIENWIVSPLAQAIISSACMRGFFMSIPLGCYSSKAFLMLGL